MVENELAFTENESVIQSSSSLVNKSAQLHTIVTRVN